MSGVSPPSRRSESSVALPSPTSNQKSNDDGRPSGEITPPSLSPLTPIDGQETDNLCQEASRIRIVDSQNKDIHFEVGSYSNPSECSSWDSIPLPPLERICHHLFDAYDGTDLTNLAKVSIHYKNTVFKFMNGPNNRPGIEDVTFTEDGDEVMVSIALYQSNLPFYDLESMDKRRFKRSITVPYGQPSPTLEVKLSGADDPIIEKMFCMFSAAIKSVYTDSLSSSSLSLCEQLLRSSTIDALYVLELNLNDTTAPLVLSIASHAKDVGVNLRWGWSFSSENFSDPASFIVKLNSMPRLSFVHLRQLSLPFFGLPISFWENYLNQKLSNGSFEWVRVGRSGERKITAPIGINPDEHICLLVWGKKNSK